jgi:hypothetical protein
MEPLELTLPRTSEKVLPEVKDPAGGAPKKTRRLSKGSSSLTLSIFSLAISIIGAVLSGVQAEASVRQAELAQAQLVSAQRLFDDSGPALNVSSRLRFWNLGSPDVISYYSAQPQTIDKSTVDRFAYTTLTVQVENTGREATTINDVWLDLRGTFGERHAAYLPDPTYDSHYCNEKPSGGQSCEDLLPHVLEPGRVYFITFGNIKSYYPDVVAQKTCTEGIPVMIDAVGLRERPTRYVAPFRAL